MKRFVVFAVCLAVVLAAEEKKDEAKDAERPKTFKRLIPADVLRGKKFSQNYYFMSCHRESVFFFPVNYWLLNGNNKTNILIIVINCKLKVYMCPLRTLFIHFINKRYFSNNFL